MHSHAGWISHPKLTWVAVSISALGLCIWLSLMMAKQPFLSYFSFSSQELFKHLPYQKCYFYCAFTLGGDACFALSAELLAMF